MAREIVCIDSARFWHRFIALFYCCGGILLCLALLSDRLADAPPYNVMHASFFASGGVYFLFSAFSAFYYPLHVCKAVMHTVWIGVSAAATGWWWSQYAQHAQAALSGEHESSTRVFLNTSVAWYERVAHQYTLVTATMMVAACSRGIFEVCYARLQCCDDEPRLHARIARSLREEAAEEGAKRHHKRGRATRPRARKLRTYERVGIFYDGEQDRANDASSSSDPDTSFSDNESESLDDIRLSESDADTKHKAHYTLKSE